MISISIIISVYNVEAYVKRCIESVMMQDQVAAKVECIIVDDCGQDNSMNIVCQLVVNYAGPIRFSILHHKKNRGLSAARNTGLERATGDYVLFIDSDDYLMPHSVQYFLDNLELHPEVDLLMGNSVNWKQDVMIPHISEPWLISDKSQIFQCVLNQKINVCAWAKLIRRNILVNNNILFEEGILYEDILWAYRLFPCISSVVLLPRVVYSYDYNPGSIVATTFTKEKADRVLYSYTVSANKLLDTPPNQTLYKRNLTVDYLLFICHFLMKGFNVWTRCKVSEDISHGFHKVKCRLCFRSLRYGRLLTSCLILLFLLLFRPFGILQHSFFFRHHYYRLEKTINRLAHTTDFLHNKFRI